MVLKRIAAALLLIVPGVLIAQSTERVVIHGFGEWAYARTDGNEYLGGTEDGDYDQVGLAVNLSSEITERLRIVGQLALRTQDEETPTAEIDYAFARWQLNNSLQLRVGRAKHPFGIYTETFDVGTLRPFFYLPQSVYGPSEIAAQSYDGIGLTGTRSHLEYDFYAGEIGYSGGQQVGEQEGGEKVRDVFGGRLRFTSSIPGLQFGASAYTGTLEPDDEEEGEARHLAYGVHLEYAAAPWTVRAEIGKHSEEDEADTTGAYVETAYRFASSPFELAARFDSLEIAEEDDDALEHRDLAIGVNYWFNPNFVMKLSAHRVKGLAVVRADDDDADDRTTAIVFGGQFSF